MRARSTPPLATVPMLSKMKDYCLSAIAYLKVEVIDDQELHVDLSEGDSPALRNLGHGLLVSYLVDEGDYYSYVQERHLAESDVTLEQLHAHAVANLSAIVEAGAEVQQYGNIYAVLMGGNLEASVVLVNQFWSEWYAELAPNGFVAAFPARDILAFGDASSAVALEELAMVCERTKGQVDHPLSQSLFRRVGTAWEPLSG